MTSLDPPRQPYAGKLPINMQVGVIAGPEGPIGALTIQTGATSFTLMVTEAEADQLAQALPKMLTQVSTTIKRERLGLVVPDAPIPPNLLRPNGHGRP